VAGSLSGDWVAAKSAGEFAEEAGFVHVILEGFAAVDENEGDFIGELAGGWPTLSPKARTGAPSFSRSLREGGAFRGLVPQRRSG